MLSTHCPETGSCLSQRLKIYYFYGKVNWGGGGTLVCLLYRSSPCHAICYGRFHCSLIRKLTHGIYNVMYLLSQQYIYRRIPQICPPFLHASIRQNRGGGLCTGSWYFRVTTTTDRLWPRGRAISVLLLVVWWIKLEKNDEVSFDMTYSYVF